MNIVESNGFTESQACDFVGNNIISAENSGDDAILTIYFSIFEKEKRIPSLYEVVEKVTSYNDKLLDEAARRVVEREECFVDAVDDRISEVSEYISYNVYFENSVDAHIFVESVMYRHKLSFAIDESSEIYYEKNIDKLKKYVIANDSQTILFESMIGDNYCTGYGSFVNYYDIELENMIRTDQLLLGGG